MNKKSQIATTIGLWTIFIFMILYFLFLVLAFMGFIPFYYENENKAFTSIRYRCETKEGRYFEDSIEDIPDNFIIKKNHPYDIVLDGDKCNIVIYCEKSQ